MNKNNSFDLIITVVFAMSPHIGGLGPKTKDLVIPFRLYEVETLPQFYLRALHIRSDFLLLQDKTGQTNNLTDK